jgi:hypothetical protein
MGAVFAMDTFNPQCWSMQLSVLVQALANDRVVSHTSLALMNRVTRSPKYVQVCLYGLVCLAFVCRVVELLLERLNGA